MSRIGSLCRDFGTLIKRKKNQLCDNMTTEPARLAGILVLWCGISVWNFPSNHACRSARRMNQERNKTADNTLLMHAASSLYIKMVAQGWPGSCNTGIKVNSAELASLTNRASPGHIIRPLLWVVLSRSLQVKALEFATFVVRVWKKST